MDQLERLYQDAIAEFQPRPRTPAADDESRLAARYLAWLSPFMNGRANERDTALNELTAYARSLEQDREARAVAVEQERAARVGDGVPSVRRRARSSGCPMASRT